MVFACKKHMNRALKLIFLPHIQPISTEHQALGTMKCRICGHLADYKLYNFEPHRKQVI